MKATNRFAGVLVALVLAAVGAAVFAARVAAQGDTWLVTRADYGYKSQRTDVTDLVQDLISRGGVNGRVAVNNQTMGGDPAVGQDKSLRIFARSKKGQEREFDYKEGGFVEIGMFSVPVSKDWDDRARNDGRGGRDGYSGDRDRDRGRDDWNPLSVIRGYYGVQGRMVNVSDTLRSAVHDGQLTIRVNNISLGGDPALGADKFLIVIYRYQGREQATIAREGNTLSIP
jgi:hypothetical protein